jgi:D-beta-D-heptose 7-phosphate kinase/D-beta-D-heptose 1-phosphate adenosyltransferase
VSVARDRAEAAARVGAWRAQGRRVVFTNGVFDLLHAGHVEYLEMSRALGSALVVGVNSDASVRRIKGEKRPLVPQEERAEILAALECVDLVVIFDEETPGALIEALTPDVLVKGADWGEDEIVGADWVRAHGGRVERIALRPGVSTTAIIARVVEGRSARDP